MDSLVAARNRNIEHALSHSSLQKRDLTINHGDDKDKAANKTNVSIFNEVLIETYIKLHE